MNKFANRKGTFISVVLITILIAYVAIFGFKAGPINLKGASDMRFGIDIRGGIDAVFKPKDLDRKPTEPELEAARTIMEDRLDRSNILDREVTIDLENGYVFVRFPWKADDTEHDAEKAIAELGDMALLSFKDPEGNIVIEGKHVESASPGTDQEKPGSYVVNLTLKTEGRELFAEATGRLIGQRISIYLDDFMISSPTVQAKIDSNQCVINGMATLEDARDLSNKINSGALPFALVTENYSTISPDLGSDALRVMVMAGIIAFALVCLALIFYYRLSGVIAAFSLLLQVTGQILMITWPQITITLPGIAGIILSIGMGVDANVIVSERIREELKNGKTLRQAVASGFKMAFSSIFDGNVTVLIAAFVMMYFGSGAILSFAYTLLFGIIMNFVAGVTATKLMTTSIVQNNFINKTSFFLSKRSLEKKEVRIFPFYKKRKVYYAISGCIMAFGLIMTIKNGVTLDINFSGGTIVQYAMSEEVELDPNEAANIAEKVLEGRPVTGQIKENFATKEKKLVLSVTGGDSVDNEDMSKVTEALVAAYPEQEFEQVDLNNVSPFFSKKFLKNGILSVVISAVLIVLYVWFSFRKIHGLSAGAMALLALLHDLLVVFFAFTIFRIPIGDSFIAVALTILGYSINDTIVIYDRIRENASTFKTMSVEDVVDKSVSQSFTRSLNTNLAVFASIAILLVFSIMNGLDSVSSFALPMAIGSISGCYSTVCFAGPLWALWQKHKGKKTAGEL